MTLLEVYSTLKKLEQPLLLTRDVAAFLKINANHANKILTRLQKTGQVLRIAPGKWIFPELVDSLALPSYLTSPFPSYVSLQSALYYHGMISQIPQITYCVSIGRTKQYRTPLGSVSVHHMKPDFFFGYETKKTGVNIAIPEKAILDIYYFFQTKTRLFRSLPEIEFPKNFNWKKAKRMALKIPSSKRQALVLKKLDALTPTPK